MNDFLAGPEGLTKKTSKFGLKTISAQKEVLTSNALARIRDDASLSPSFVN